MGSKQKTEPQEAPSPWFITTYNRFIKYKNRIEEAWSGIDVALKRRFDLIPNLRIKPHLWSKRI